MADLISRALALEVINAVKGVTWSQSGKVLCGKMFSQIKDLPAVDAAPVVHARWDILISEHYGQKWQADATCPLCDFMKYNIWSGFFPDVPANTARSITGKYARNVKLPNYCENCGAKMDGESDG